MNEIVANWFIDLYDQAIKEAKSNISNEHLWELGYDGGDPNPHTFNIECLKKYIESLENEKNRISENVNRSMHQHNITNYTLPV